MRAIVDVDDTLCVVRNRDYAGAEPKVEVIEKVRELKRMGFEIVLHTSRGMMSCGGDVQAARRKNEEVMKEWLERNGVPYDEIVWGKPFGDVYVDDKGMSLEEFKRKRCAVKRGFSGSQVVLVGNTAIKDCGSKEKAQEQVEWYERARMYGFDTPRVWSCSFGKIFMERLDRELLSEALGMADQVGTERLLICVDVVLRAMERAQEEGENDVEEYVEYVRKRGEDCGVRQIEDICREVSRHEGMLRRRTFCHGDFSGRNVFVKRGYFPGMVLIDPSVKEMSTWLLDAAKMRASLRGLDAVLGGVEYEDWVVEYYDRFFTEEELEVVKALEVTHYVRVLYYARKLHRQTQERKLRTMIDRACGRR